MSEKKTSQFLPSLFRMCNNDDETHRSCINWSDDLKSFWVSNLETFSRMILPMYFKHNNYASFVRQLNMYGFHRSTEPRGKVVPGAPMVEHFTHPFFVKGREDLLKNIHRKTSSSYKGARRAGAGKGVGGAAASGLCAKEARQMQQIMMEQEEKISQIFSDVEVLKKNQMQLANTIQAMHGQTVQMQTEMAVTVERLDTLIRTLAMHNVEVESPAEAARQREAAREQAALEQSRHLAQQQMLHQPVDLQPPGHSPAVAESGFGGGGMAAGSLDLGGGLGYAEDGLGDGMAVEGMEFDQLFEGMDGDGGGGGYDPLY